MEKGHKKRGNYEKPVKLEMDFNEALERLSKVKKEEMEEVRDHDEPKEANEKKE